jgi:hypothetical protein
MDARKELYAFGMSGKEHSPDNSDRMSEKIDAYRAEVLREAHDAVRLDLSKLAEAEPFSYGMAYQQGMDWAAQVVDQLIDSP